MNTSVQLQDPALDELDDGPSVSLVDLLTWVGESKRFIGGIALATGVVAAGISLLLPNVYTARTTMVPPNSQQQSGSAAALAALGNLGGLAGGLGAKTPDELYVNLLRSDTVLRALDTQFKLKDRYEAKTYEELKSKVAKYIRQSAEKKSGIITVEVDDEDPQFAADLANAHSAEITRLLSRLAMSEAQQRRVFFESQLKDTKENLIKAEQALRQVQEKSGMVVLDKQAEAIIEAVAQLKTRIAEREIRLKVLRTATTAENPDVRMLMSELAALRAELARMESSTVAQGQGGEGGIDIPIGRLPSAAVDYVRAMREVKFQETMLTSMLKQFEVARLDEAKDAPALQQVDVALPPDRKSKPKRAVIAVGATLFAFFLASIWTIWRRYSALARANDPERAQALDGLRRAWRLRG
jgi:capsule polysaccharide export protein KpsE/RkpR